MWQDHFSTLLNGVRNIDSKEFVCERIEHGIANKEIVAVSATDVLDSLKAVKLGKTAGIDGLSAEYFVCAHIGFSFQLSLLFISILTHGHMPAELMKTAIVPILKNRQGDTSDKNNYNRSIAIVMALSKILPVIISLGLNVNMVLIYVYLLLSLLSNIITCIIVLCIHVFLTFLKPMIVLTTGHCLENYSTDQFIFLLLECLYIGTESKNYVLGGELKCRHILLFLMEYDKEEYCLHRYLLYIYYSLLNTSRIGCHIDDVCINHVHVCYADDLCLMPPCAIALQELINVCYQLYYCIICLFQKHSPYKSLQI